MNSKSSCLLVQKPHNLYGVLFIILKSMVGFRHSGLYCRGTDSCSHTLISRSVSYFTKYILQLQAFNCCLLITCKNFCIKIENILKKKFFRTNPNFLSHFLYSNLLGKRAHTGRRRWSTVGLGAQSSFLFIQKVENVEL